MQASPEAVADEANTHRPCHHDASRDPFAATPGKWHATWCSSSSSLRGGSCSRQRLSAYWHLGWYRQPDGMFTGLGTSPLASAAIRRASGSGTGMAEINAEEYGCSGLAKSAADAAISTILPRYITATTSLIDRVTTRLCEMSR